MKMTVQWWELPMALTIVVSVGGLVIWLINERFKQLDKIYGKGK
jgi:hypothetical protein